MTDTPICEECPGTGDGFADGVLFAVASAVVLGATVVGSHVLTEMLRRQDSKGMER